MYIFKRGWYYTQHLQWNLEQLFFFPFAGYLNGLILSPMPRLIGWTFLKVQTDVETEVDA